MGGDTWAESPGAGHGSTFHCEIVAPRATSIEEETDPFSSSANPDLCSMTCLLVEQQDMTRDVLRQLIGQMGPTTSAVSSWDAAYALILERSRAGKPYST